MTPSLTSTRFPSAAATGSPRLLLRGPRTLAGPLDGAWWPRTANPEAELRDLIAIITPRIGQLIRVRFDWTTEGIVTERSCVHTGPTMPSIEVRAGGIMRLFGLHGNWMSLLVIPADTTPELAAVQMRRATGQPLPDGPRAARSLRNRARTGHGQPMPEVSDRQASHKDYLELIRDLIALRRSRSTAIDDAELDRTIREHEEELSRRDRHGR